MRLSPAEAIMHRRQALDFPAGGLALGVELAAVYERLILRIAACLQKAQRFVELREHCRKR